jgi:hypothetical protein
MESLTYAIDNSHLVTETPLQDLARLSPDALRRIAGGWRRAARGYISQKRPADARRTLERAITIEAMAEAARRRRTSGGAA